MWRPAPAIRPARDRARSRIHVSRSAGTAARSDTRGCPRDRAASGSRASMAAGSRSDVPRAPARWATLVSTVITRSRQAINAAVSAKSVRSAVRSTMSLRSRSTAASCGRGAFCRLTKLASTSRIRAQRSQRNRARLIVHVVWIAGPDQADPKPGSRAKTILPGLNKAVRQGRADTVPRGSYRDGS